MLILFQPQTNRVVKLLQSGHSLVKSWEKQSCITEENLILNLKKALKQLQEKYLRTQPKWEPS